MKMHVQYTLKVEEPDRDPRIVNLMEPEILIGREQGGLPLADPQISTRHLTLSTKNHQLFAKDLQSTNGTRLNGKVLQPQTLIELRAGDVLVLGKSSRITCLSVDVVHQHQKQPPPPPPAAVQEGAGGPPRPHRAAQAAPQEGGRRGRRLRPPSPPRARPSRGVGITA